jgi:hypothetical protein
MLTASQQHAIDGFAEGLLALDDRDAPKLVNENQADYMTAITTNIRSFQQLKSKSGQSSA